MSGAVLTLCGVASGGSAPSGIIMSDTQPTSIGSGARTAGYRIDSDGYVYHLDNATPTTQFQWNQSGNASSAYEAQALVTLGSVSGTTGSWVGLGTDRDWSVSDLTADGEGKIATMVIQIRDVATSTIQASGTIDFYADRYS